MRTTTRCTVRSVELRHLGDLAREVERHVAAGALHAGVALAAEAKTVPLPEHPRPDAHGIVHSHTNAHAEGHRIVHP